MKSALALVLKLASKDGFLKKEKRVDRAQAAMK